MIVKSQLIFLFLLINVIIESINSELIITKDNEQFVFQDVFPTYSLLGTQTGEFQGRHIRWVTSEEFQTFCHLDNVGLVSKVFGTLSSDTILLFDSRDKPYNFECSGHLGGGDDFIAYWCSINVPIVKFIESVKPGMWANKQFGNRFRDMNKIYPDCVFLETGYNQSSTLESLISSENTTVTANVTLIIDNNYMLDWLKSPVALVFLRILPTIGFTYLTILAAQIIFERIRTRTMSVYYRNICFVSLFQAITLMICTALGNRYADNLLPYWMVVVVWVDFMGLSFAADAWLMTAYIRYREQMDVAFIGPSNTFKMLLRIVPVFGLGLDIVIGVVLLISGSAISDTFRQVTAMLAFFGLIILTVGNLIQSFGVLKLFQAVADSDSEAVEMPLLRAIYNNLNFSVIGMIVSSVAMILAVIVFIALTPTSVRYPGFFIFWGVFDYVSIARIYFHLSYCKVIRINTRRVYSQSTEHTAVMLESEMRKS